MEQRWLNESVPALGGVTPRQAADDPTRRDDLVRLIDGFPEPEPRRSSASDRTGSASFSASLTADTPSTASEKCTSGRKATPFGVGKRQHLAAESDSILAWPDRTYPGLSTACSLSSSVACRQYCSLDRGRRARRQPLGVMLARCCGLTGRRRRRWLQPIPTLRLSASRNQC